MLKRRLIPKLQIRTLKLGDRLRPVLVTTFRFGKYIEIGDPVSQARIYEAQAADELIILDLDASSESRKTLVDVVRKAAEVIFMPFTVGGGVRTVDDFFTLLSNGADKVSINTAAVETPDLIDKAASALGSQCVVLSIDYRRNDTNGYVVWTRGGTVRTGLDPVKWAKEGEMRGAGEILLTSIDVVSVSVPVITSGGCGLAAHFVDGYISGKADAVSAGTYFCFKDENTMQVRSHIKNAGVPIRLHH
jgi:cyclase